MMGGFQPWEQSKKKKKIEDPTDFLTYLKTTFENHICQHSQSYESCNDIAASQSAFVQLDTYEIGPAPSSVSNTNFPFR